MVALFTLAAQSVFGQVAGDYRSVASGTWTAISTWETNNGTTWVPASVTPTSANANIITIRSPHAVTNSLAALSIDQVVIDSGGTFVLSNAVTTTLANGAGTDMTVNGTFINSGNVTWTGTMVVNAGGTYVHNTSSSAANALGAATLDPASTWIYRGSDTLTPPTSFSARTYGTLIYESTNGIWTVAANTGTATCTVNSNLLIGVTGAGTVSWALTAPTVTSPFNIAGSLSIGSGSTMSLGANPITLTGNLTNNGTMLVNTNSGVFTFTNAGAAVVIAGSSAPTFGNGFVVQAGKTVSLLQNVTNSGGMATNLGTLNCGTSIILGAANFTNATGSTLGIGDPNGIAASGATGNIQVSGTRGFSSGASYVYNGAAAQATGSGLPSTVNNLIISNSLAIASGGVTLSGSVSATNRLALMAGRLITGANQVSIADAGTITNGSSSSYVDGNVQKVWASTGTKSFTFPVGTGTTFAPCAVTNLVLTAAGNLTASTTNSEHANIGTSTIDSTKSANRYWTMAAGGGLGVSTYSATCTFLAGDLDGGANSANFVMEKFNGSTWTRAASSSVSGNTVMGNGFTSFGDFAVGEPAAVSTPPSGVGGASPATVGRGNPTVLTVTVVPGTFPNSTGLTVSADLSAIGGAAVQQFYDDASHGDINGGDNVFTYATTVTTGTSIGAKSLPALITDGQLRTNTAVISVTVAGATRTWSGGGVDDNWSTSPNWSGGVAPISPEDSVVFTGSTRPTPALDSSLTVPSLTFDSGASSFTLGATGGSTLTLNGGTGLTNNSANAQAVNIPIIMGSAQTFNASGAGTLTIGGAVDNGGNLLTANGANNSSFTGAISGGGALTKAGAGTTTLSGGNSYGGATTVSAGTLAVSSGSAIPDASSVTLANVSGVTLSVGANETVGSLAGGGATGGTVALGANNLTVGGTTTYSGAVTGTGKLVRTGAGTLTLNSASAIGSGFTTRIEGGTVDFNRGGGSLVGIIGTGNSVELAGGTLQLSASVQANFAVAFDGLNVVSNSTFSFNRNGGTNSQSPVITAPLNFTGNANLAFAYSGTITNGTSSFSGAANTLGGDATLTLGSFAVTIANAIGETGGSHSLTKAGPGTLNLSAVNTYSGNTTNLAGVISLNGTSTFGDGTGTLVLAGGDILANNTRAGAPISNPVSLIASGTNTIYGDSTLPADRILPLSGTMAGTSGTLRIGNKATATNSFQVRLAGGGFTFPRPIVVGDTNFDGTNASSLLSLYNDNTTSPQIFSGVISASASGSVVRDAGASGAGGTTVLAGANTFAGGLTIARGFIGFGTNSTPTNGPVGTGVLEIDNDPNVGVFAYGGARTVENTVFFNAVTNVQFNGSNDLTLSGIVRVGGVAKTLTINNTGVTTISGVLTNTAPLTKAGAGTLVLSGANVNTGNITNTSGTLLVHGSLNVTSAVYVAGGTLGGTGLVNGPITVDVSGAFAPGASIGTLNVGSDVSLGGTTVIELDKSAIQTSDKVLGIATLSEGGVLQVSNLGPALAAGDSFPLFSAATYAGTFASVTPGPGAGLAWDTELLRTNGTLLVHANPVANDDDAGAQYGETINIPVFKALSNDTGEVGETLSITAVSANASLGGGFITYTAPYSGSSDTITYTLSDGRGGTATGTINVVLTPGGGFNQLSAVTISGGDLQLSYFGIPGTNYSLEVSHTLTPPVNWTALQTNPASGMGTIIFTNTPSLAPTNDFYRTHYVP